MPAVARNADSEMRRAWDDYAESLRGLEGPEYDRAEQEAWTRLQDTLEELRDGVPLPRRPLG